MDLTTTIAYIVALAGQSAADRYAELVLDCAKRADVDPVHVVAYIYHESNFRYDATSRDHEDIGLGQIRLRFQPACRGGLRTDECKAERDRLMVPRYNLRVLSGKIRSAKALKAYAANPRPQQWLAALAGSTNPNHKRVREMMRLVAKIKAKTEEKRAP